MVDNILLIVTLVSAIIGLIVLFIDRTTSWFHRRDTKAVASLHSVEDLAAISKVAKDCQSDINIMVKANGETNIQMVKLQDMVAGFNQHGSMGAEKAISNLEKKLNSMDDKLGIIIVGHGERLSRLEGIVINGHAKTK